jgi:hypothetical protein
MRVKTLHVISRPQVNLYLEVRQALRAAGAVPDILQSNKAEREQRHPCRLRRAFDRRRARPGCGGRHIMSAVSNGRTEQWIGRRLGFCWNTPLTNVVVQGAEGRRMKSGTWQRV